MRPLISVLAEGFILGISTGSVCAATCFPFLLPYLMAESGDGFRKQAFLLLRFFSGRLTAYLLVGAMAGWLGGRFRGYFPEWTHDWPLIILASAMMVLALERIFPKISSCPRVPKPFLSAQFPFLLGFLMGLNICPPFLIGISRLLEIGSSGLGMVFFFAFFVASSLYLLPLFLILPFFSSERMRRVGAFTSFLVGISYLAKGIFSLFPSR